MKLCHFSDSHLGAGESHRRRGTSGLTERQEDVINGFVAAVDRIIAIGPDLCIHSGDLFDSVRPLNRIMAIAAEQLHRLAAEAGIPTVVISGNHDTPRQSHVGAPLEVFSRIDNLFVAASGQLEIFEPAQGKIYALPHCHSAAALQEQLAGCIPDDSAAFNILVMHGVAAGMPEFSMADLSELEIPLDVMDRFDYTALGHYHNFRQVADRAWYAGSTERLSQLERDVAKGFVVVDLNPLAVEFQEVPTRRMITLPDIDAADIRGDQLIEAIREQVASHDAGDTIVRLTVRNATPETLNTLPAETLAELKRQAFSLEVKFEKAERYDETRQFGRAAIGRLDHAFAQYVDSVDLGGFDRQRLLDTALKYLEGDS